MFGAAFLQELAKRTASGLARALASALASDCQVNAGEMPRCSRTNPRAKRGVSRCLESSQTYRTVTGSWLQFRDGPPCGPPSVPPSRLPELRKLSRSCRRTNRRRPGRTLRSLFRLIQYRTVSTDTRATAATSSSSISSPGMVMASSIRMGRPPPPSRERMGTPLRVSGDRRWQSIVPRRPAGAG